MTPESQRELTEWIAQLYSHPELMRMGHNQRPEDLNLGLGWLYYAFARVVHPRRALVIGSYRGFVPLLIGRAFHDNQEPGEVHFIDPSMVDDFWSDPTAVKAYFSSFGVENVTHFMGTTQQFCDSERSMRLGQLGLLFVDGYHTKEQAQYDFRSFEERLAPHGFALLHDSMVERRSEIYGSDRAYDMRVKYFVEELKQEPGLQVLDVPFGTGLTIVRKLGNPPTEPFLEGEQARP